MTIKQPDFSDLNALAIEACDMWQEHLSNLANNPEARAELTRYLEPQRRLFADWATMMQPGNLGGTGHEPNRTSASPTTDSYKSSPQSQNAKSSDAPPPSTSSSATQSGTPHADDPLRVAQLALRLAELEKRVAQLEAKSVSAARRTQRSAS